MHRSTRKWVITGLEVICLVAGVWRGPWLFNYLTSRPATMSDIEKRARPNELVRQLLRHTDTAVPRIDGKFACVSATVEDSKPHAQLGKCAMPTEHSGPVDRFEADLRYGNFIVRQTDLYVNDVFDVPLTRSYNSGDYLNRNPAFGRHANHPFDWSPVGSRFPYTYLMTVLEDGDFLYFPRVSPGTGFEDAVYQHTETSTNFYKAVIAWNGNGWTLFREDGSTLLFPESYYSTSGAQSAPYAMRNADGNTLNLIRDKHRNLMEIQTPHKHWIRFEYDGNSRITKAVDDQGNSSEYRYDGNGMLTDVTFSTGLARHYTYEDDLMIEVADEKHQVLLRNTYDHRWLVRQDFGEGEIYSYSYDFSRRTDTYADSATVTPPSGTRMTVIVGDSVPEDRKNPPR